MLGADDVKRDKNFNYLTGSAMTNNNAEKLKNVTSNIIVDKRGGTRVYLNE